MNNVIVEEITLNHDQFTLVKIEEAAETYQMSVRGHNVSSSKVARCAASLRKHIHRQGVLQ